MPVIAKILLNSGAKYIANYSYNDTRHFWPFLQSVNSCKRKMEFDHGGFCDWDYGSITFVPTLFEDDWPPPMSCPLEYLKYTDASESEAALIAEGVLKLSKISRKSIKYDLYGQEYSDTVNTQSYNDSLVNIFSSACTTLGLTLDSSKVRTSPPPAIVYTTSTSDTLLIDELSKMAAWCTHYFYIDGTTLYLIDMLSDNGITTITEFDILPSNYSMNPGYSLIKGDDYSVDGTDVIGEEYSVSPVCHDFEPVIIDDLTRIKLVVESTKPTFKMPLQVNKIPVIGERLELVDASKLLPISAWGRVSGIAFKIDTNTEEIIVECVGGVL